MPLLLYTAHLSGRDPRRRRARPTEDGKVKVVFKDTEGGSEECYAKVGEHILDVALENDIELEGQCAVDGGSCLDPRPCRGEGGRPAIC